MAFLGIIEKYLQQTSENSPGIQRMSKEERNSIIESIKNFKAYGDVIYRSSKIREAVEEISSLAEAAKSVALQETSEWFDEITVNRHAKQIDEAVKILRTEASEISKRQQRLEAAYEDIGQLLGKYYEV